MVNDLLELQFTCKHAVSQQRHLLNVAVHDLKNPLANISIRAQLIQRKKDDPSAVSQLGQQIREASLKIIAQVSDLLDSGRTVTDESLNYKPLSLELILNKVAAASSAMADYKDQRLNLEITVQPLILGDELQLGEIIDNLLSNAIKYSFIGGVIKVKLYQTIDKAIISVRDNGPGFSAEDHQKMFSPFARLSAKPTAEESATGLGLSIVRQLVEQHGGKVYAGENPNERGANMIVELPLIIQNEYFIT